MGQVACFPPGPAEALHLTVRALQDVVGIATGDDLEANLLHGLLLADHGVEGAGGDACSHTEGRKPFGALLN